MIVSSEELGMNLEPLAANQQIRMIVEIHSGYWPEYRTNLKLDGHGYGIRPDPRFCVRITSE